MQLTHIPISGLAPSPLNIRHGRNKPDLTDLLPSVRARGVLAPLVVRPACPGPRVGGSPETFEVIGGRRCLFAARAVAREAGTGETEALLPCHVLGETDEADAVEASMLENLARLDPAPMQQCAAFGRLVAEGRTPEDVAERFGVSVLIVRRRLALADLTPQVRKGVSEERIDLPTAQTPTLASLERQAAWLQLFEADERQAPRGRALRDFVLGGGEIETGVALFDLADYEVVTDLFGEKSVFGSADDFWCTQDGAVDAMVRGYEERGWTKVTVLWDCRFDEWRHEKARKAEGGEVFVEVRRSGAVVRNEGWKPKPIARTEPGERTKQEMSGPLADYVALHRHAVARAATACRPEDALRLVIAHVIAGSGATPLLETPYQRAGQVWDDRIGSARLRAANWCYACFGALGLAILSTGALAWRSGQSLVTPYVVELTEDGAIRNVGPAAAAYEPTDAQLAHHLARFVANVRSVSIDPVVVRGNWLEADAYATDKAALTLNEYARTNDPFAELGRRSLAVDVNSVVRSSEDSFEPRWLEAKYIDGVHQGTATHTAVFSVMIDSPTDEETLHRNPLGIYVHGINWSKDLTQGER